MGVGAQPQGLRRRRVARRRLKRDPQWEGPYEAYQQSAKVSNGHTYPLLNALTLRAFDGRLGG